MTMYDMVCTDPVCVLCPDDVDPEAPPDADSRNSPVAMATTQEDNSIRHLLEGKKDVELTSLALDSDQVWY